MSPPTTDLQPVIEWSESDLGAVVAGATNIQARRKLSDLYKKGVEVRFGPGPDKEPVGKIGPFVDSDGHPIKVLSTEIAMFVQPPSPLQREMALRDAQAARSKALVRAK